MGSLHPSFRYTLFGPSLLHSPQNSVQLDGLRDQKVVVDALDGVVRLLDLDYEQLEHLDRQEVAKPEGVAVEVDVALVEAPSNALQKTFFNGVQWLIHMAQTRRSTSRQRRHLEKGRIQLLSHRGEVKVLDFHPKFARYVLPTARR